MPAASRHRRSINRVADRWFREQGLPTFVPLRRWFTDLARRVAPLLVSVTLLSVLFSHLASLVDAALAAIGEPESDDVIVGGVALVVFVVGIAVAWTGYLAARALLRALPTGPGVIVALIIVAVFASWMVWNGYLLSPDSTVGPVVEVAVVLGLSVLVTGMGGGALISWASRLAVRNAAAVGHMASLALPVILMLVVFAFFSSEVWQMSSALPWSSFGLLALLVAVLATVVVLRVSASEIDDSSQVTTIEQRAALIVGTPAAEGDPTAAPPRRLQPAQRLNILLAMTFAQLVQALFFAALLCGLLIVIGTITVPLGIVELWVGTGTATLPLAVEPVRVGSITLPTTVNLLKSATLLSLIATLPFVFSAVSESRYRERFFDPIMADMRRAIVVRETLDASQAG